MSPDAHQKAYQAFPESAPENHLEEVIDLIRPPSSMAHSASPLTPAVSAYQKAVGKLLLWDGLLISLCVGIFQTLLAKSTLSLTVSTEAYWLCQGVTLMSIALGLQYFNLAESRHIFGKALIAALGLLLVQAAMIHWSQEPVSMALLLGSAALYSSAALLSAWSHYEASRPYITKKPAHFYYRLEQGIKRAFDLAACSLGIIIVSPLLLIVSLILRLEGQGSPFFCQPRVGKGEKLFKMHKFRSMKRNTEHVRPEQKAVLYKCQDDPRITQIGRWIRKLSIDELPQLWNVVQGDMSMVGPRPPLESEYQLMNWYHKRKFEVAPGMTGLWQIIGRVKNQRDFNSVAAYDVYYIENWCLMEDLKILLKTIPVVLFQRGAS